MAESVAESVAGSSVAGSSVDDTRFTQLLVDDAEQQYDRAPCGFVSTTPDGVIVRVNEAFLAMTGHDREVLVGRRALAELLTIGSRLFFETHVAPMLRMGGSAKEIALDLVRADGHRTPVLINSVLDRDADGVPLVVRTAVFDATDRRSYERELVEAKHRAEASEANAMALARTLQRTLIPPEPPQVPGLDIAAVYRPAGSGAEVGGDFYDVFEVQQGRWVVAIGDVCGKGIDAAVVTALARYTLRAAAVSMSRPSEALRVLNEVLLRSDTDRFCTVGLLLLVQDEAGWTATISCGGHPLPLLWRGGHHVQAAGGPGSLIGVLPDPSFLDTEIRLRAGDTILMYTDGITEGRRVTDFYGEDRLNAAIEASGGNTHDLVNGILSEVLEFQSDDPRDDIAVVAVSVPFAD